MTGSKTINRRAAGRGGFFSPAGRWRPAALALALAGATACGNEPSIPAPPALGLTALPAPGAAQWPRLRPGSDGGVYASWIEQTPGGVSTLRFARFDGGRWSGATAVASGAGWFVNWADFPSVTGYGDNLVAHWMVDGTHGPGTYSVAVSQSPDRGRTWSKSRRPYRGGSRSEQGFVTLLPDATGVDMLWLDGRDPDIYPGSSADVEASGREDVVGTVAHAGPGDHGHANAVMRLRYARIGNDGVWHDERVVDSRTCDCCHTDAARSDAGLVVVYRDRDQNEVRDISRLVRTAAGTWLLPMPVAHDGWRIDGCPVNGPAIAARGMQVAVAWYTGEPVAPGVRLARSSDGGITFGVPRQVSQGLLVAGRTDVVLDADGAAVVSWVEHRGDGPEPSWLLRRFRPDGRAGPVREIMTLPPGRKSGFPQMVALPDDTLLLAWTDWQGDVSRVRAATLQPVTE